MNTLFHLHYPDTLLRAAAFVDAEANAVLHENAIALTFMQYRILSAVAHGITTASDIAEHLAISHPAMSRHVKNLEAKKLIVRFVNEETRRIYSIELTSRGAEFHKQSEQTLSKNLKKTFINVSSSARQSVLITLEKTIIACAHEDIVA